MQLCAKGENIRDTDSPYWHPSRTTSSVPVAYTTLWVAYRGAPLPSVRRRLMHLDGPLRWIDNPVFNDAILRYTIAFVPRSNQLFASGDVSCGFV